jgi:hypothetical protein
LPENRRNIFDAGENFLAARIIVGLGNRERFRQRGERLLDIKIRIAFTARIKFQLPADP